MQTISIQTIDFLKELKKNNNREWFNDHKKWYQESLDEFKAFVNELIVRISISDKSIAHLTAKDAVFRIYRDIRFSPDKSPYKTHFGAHIASTFKKSEIHSRAGYYIHIEPGDSMIGGGAWLPETSWLKAIRQEIYYNARELHDILNHPDFKKYFRTIEGEKLKKAPKDYPADHADIEFLKLKSFLAGQNLSDEKIVTKNFMEHCIKAFHTLYPFNRFLNQVLD